VVKPFIRRTNMPVPQRAYL